MNHVFKKNLWQLSCEAWLCFRSVSAHVVLVYPIPTEQYDQQATGCPTATFRIGLEVSSGTWEMFYLLREHFIRGCTHALHLLLIAATLLETPLRKSFLQDFAHLSLLILLTILPSTCTTIIFFLSQTGICLSYFIGSMNHQLERSFLCPAGLWMDRGPAVVEVERSINKFVSYIFRSS